MSTSEDRVREMIHRFNEQGMRSLDPQWAGGRPRQITTDDVTFIVATARQRPEALGHPFTRRSIRKLVDYLADNPERVVHLGRERCRQILIEHDITFQRTKTWKESNDPDRDAKLDRIEHVLDQHPDRKIREWAARNRVELCFTPTYSSWVNPIEAHFGPLREFVLNNSTHPNHIVLTQRLHAHLRWRNDNARAPELLAAQRRERARVRAEKGRRWGRPATRAA